MILVGQFPWKQENVHVNLVAAFFHSHVLLFVFRKEKKENYASFSRLTTSTKHSGYVED